MIAWAVFQLFVPTKKWNDWPEGKATTRKKQKMHNKTSPTPPERSATLWRCFSKDDVHKLTSFSSRFFVLRRVLRKRVFECLKCVDSQSQRLGHLIHTTYTAVWTRRGRIALQ